MSDGVRIPLDTSEARRELDALERRFAQLEEKATLHVGIAENGGGVGGAGAGTGMLTEKLGDLINVLERQERTGAARESALLGRDNADTPSKRRSLWSQDDIAGYAAENEGSGVQGAVKGIGGNASKALRSIGGPGNGLASGVDAVTGALGGGTMALAAGTIAAFGTAANMVLDGGKQFQAFVAQQLPMYGAAAMNERGKTIDGNYMFTRTSGAAEYGMTAEQSIQAGTSYRTASRITGPIDYTKIARLQGYGLSAQEIGAYEGGLAAYGGERGAGIQGIAGVAASAGVETSPFLAMITSMRNNIAASGGQHDQTSFRDFLARSYEGGQRGLGALQAVTGLEQAGISVGNEINAPLAEIGKALQTQEAYRRGAATGAQGLEFIGASGEAAKSMSGQDLAELYKRQFGEGGAAAIISGQTSVSMDTARAVASAAGGTSSAGDPTAPAAFITEQAKILARASVQDTLKGLGDAETFRTLTIATRDLAESSRNLAGAAAWIRKHTW